MLASAAPSQPQLLAPATGQPPASTPLPPEQPGTGSKTSLRASLPQLPGAHRQSAADPAAPAASTGQVAAAAGVPAPTSSPAATTTTTTRAAQHEHSLMRLLQWDPHVQAPAAPAAPAASAAVPDLSDWPLGWCHGLPVQKLAVAGPAAGGAGRQAQAPATCEQDPPQQPQPQPHLGSRYSGFMVRAQQLSVNHFGCQLACMPQPARMWLHAAAWLLRWCHSQLPRALRAEQAHRRDRGLALVHWAPESVPIKHQTWSL